MDLFYDAQHTQLLVTEDTGSGLHVSTKNCPRPHAKHICKVSLHDLLVFAQVTSLETTLMCVNAVPVH